jgi:hypothetical protein
MLRDFEMNELNRTTIYKINQKFIRDIHSLKYVWVGIVIIFNNFCI